MHKIRVGYEVTLTDEEFKKATDIVKVSGFDYKDGLIESIRKILIAEGTRVLDEDQMTDIACQRIDVGQ